MLCTHSNGDGGAFRFALICPSVYPKDKDGKVWASMSYVHICSSGMDIHCSY